MANNHSLFTCLALFSLASKICHGYNLTGSVGSGWAHTKATYYGDPHGAGSLGGACGYQEDVQSQPYHSLIAAVGTPFFQDGGGCGTCYQIMCNLPSCSGRPVTVVATDQCPDGACTKDHLFDLSGATTDALAKPGEGQQLRNVGVIDVLYKLAQCNFGGARVTFRVDPGSSSYYLAVTIEYANGNGITAVQVKAANSNTWVKMTRSWGALFKVQFTEPASPPLSFQLTDHTSQTIVANNAIPINYGTGVHYVSTVNFK